jgi:hypothetical protein
MLPPVPVVVPEPPRPETPVLPAPFPEQPPFPEFDPVVPP